MHPSTVLSCVMGALFFCDRKLSERFLRSCSVTILVSRVYVFFVHPQGLTGEDQANALLGMADWLQAEGFYPQAAETYLKVKQKQLSLPTATFLFLLAALVRVFIDVFSDPRIN